LLLDIHIPPAVAAGVVARRPNCTVVSLRDWRDGAYRSAADADILKAAHDEGLTLITFDLRSIRPLLRAWGTERRVHAGVILIDERTIRQDDVGGLIRSLTHLWDHRSHEDWTNVVEFLRRAPN
jgi:hypothetical protein